MGLSVLYHSGENRTQSRLSRSAVFEPYSEKDLVGGGDLILMAEHPKNIASIVVEYWQYRLERPRPPRNPKHKSIAPAFRCKVLQIRF